MGLEKYPLLTQKAADFILFKQVLDLIKEKDNLSIEGISKIINIKASMNLGISETQKSNFSLTLWADAVVKKAEVLINPVVRPVIITNNIFDPNWISGFVSGEGNFDAGIRKSTPNIFELNKVKKCKPAPGPGARANILGSRVYLRFRVSQHERDTQLINVLIKYLGAGRVEKDIKKPIVHLVVGNFSDLTNIVIPFFKKYPILGTKKLDAQDWFKIANLMSLGANKTIEGLESIRLLESGMNKGR